MHMCRIAMDRLAFVIIVLCLARPSEAQPELSVSLKAGPDAAVWDRAHHEHTYGFTGGAAGDLLWPVGSRLSLGGQLAMLYVPRGTEFIDQITGESLGPVRQHYFDVSAALRPQARVGSFSAYFLLGGSWSILVDAYSDTRDLTFRRHDVALLVGLGGALHLPSRRLGPFRLGTVFLEARYDRGLLDFTHEDDSSAKNRTTSLMFGISFALGSGMATTSRDPAGTTASLAK